MIPIKIMTVLKTAMEFGEGSLSLTVVEFAVVTLHYAVRMVH